MITEMEANLATYITTKLLDELPKDEKGRRRMPKTANRARPARSNRTAGWGWTHYFLLPDETVVGYKLVDNPVAIERAVRQMHGDGLIMHLGRAVQDDETQEFYF